MQVSGAPREVQDGLRDLTQVRNSVGYTLYNTVTNNLVLGGAALEEEADKMG